MQINANFDERALARTEAMDWVPSPMPGVDRRMLDRIGDEVARATSIVRYAPGSHFSAHVHGGGEEFIVLDGIFQDEHGDYPSGTYVRNPPTSSHTPASEPGCTIFVKLWQFDPDDRTHVRLDVGALLDAAPASNDVREITLHQDPHEHVRAMQLRQGARVALGDEGGAELLVLEGTVSVDDVTLRKHDWLRLPRAAFAELAVASARATIWMKTGHLIRIEPPT